MIEFLKSDKFISPIIYIIMGFVLLGSFNLIVNKLVKRGYVDKKKKTMISLIKNIIKYLIYSFVILSILKVYGVDTSGILASLGIAGLIIGFALQDIIADFVAGIFILFDNQYAIGDIVSINDFMGEVISFGLMSTKIKNYNGDIFIISNSSFKEVINYSLSNNNLIITINVDYDTDIDKLENALRSITDLVKKMENVVGDYSLLGINEISNSGIKYLVCIECKANCQYQIKRDYLKILKRTMDKYKIKLGIDKIDVNIRGKYE